MTYRKTLCPCCKTEHISVWPHTKYEVCVTCKQPFSTETGEEFYPDSIPRIEPLPNPYIIYEDHVGENIKFNTSDSAGVWVGRVNKPPATLLDYYTELPTTFK